ncbi:MAG: hypothetical protein C5S47_03680 [Candidatus Methanogasteraceae archaeon]|nr:MAG: hypothetical protein C5S47_03680 [ANME-2 cluster archaeon]
MARFWDVELTRIWRVFITPGVTRLLMVVAVALVAVLAAGVVVGCWC